MTIRRAFVRCIDGHYFNGSVCPFDGWSIDGLGEVQLAQLRLEDAGAEISLEALRAEGLTDAIAERLVVIEFTSPASIFDAIEPRGIIVGGQYLALDALGPELR